MRPIASYLTTFLLLTTMSFCYFFNYSSNALFVLKKQSHYTTIYNIYFNCIIKFTVLHTELIVKNTMGNIAPIRDFFLFIKCLKNFIRIKRPADLHQI